MVQIKFPNFVTIRITLMVYIGYIRASSLPFDSQSQWVWVAYEKLFVLWRENYFYEFFNKSYIIGTHNTYRGETFLLIK